MQTNLDLTVHHYDSKARLLKINPYICLVGKYEESKFFVQAGQVWDSGGELCPLDKVPAWVRNRILAFTPEALAKTAFKVPADWAPEAKPVGRPPKGD